MKRHYLVKKSVEHVSFCYKKSQPSEKSHENVNFCYKTSQPSDKKSRKYKLLL